MASKITKTTSAGRSGQAKDILTPRRSGALANVTRVNVRLSGNEEHSRVAQPKQSRNRKKVEWSGQVRDSSWKLINGDSRTSIAALPAESIDCVVTSPPYYWQRDYGVDGQVGQEASISGYVDTMREIFEGVWHALKPGGTVFLNLGDTYYSAKGRPHGADSKQKARNLARQSLRAVDGPGLGLPRKSLIGIPWRVALALAEDGWTLRSDVIWIRNTAIPEPSAKDRPWRKHEHVFIFSKGPKYYFDRAALNGEEDVWLIEPDRNAESRGVHYAPFPKALAARCIRLGCPPGGVVLDPFVGGGTTMSAALQEGRSVVGVELNSEFCQLINRNLSRGRTTK